MKSPYTIGVTSPCLSHPARGAWIEMVPLYKHQIKAAVAPRKGCVD